MDHRTKEALRYLGYGRNPGEERTLELIRQSFEELEGLREERIVWRREPVTVREPDQVETAGMDIRSRGLARNLKGCREVILAAATLGTRTDLLLRRYSRTDMTRAVILQACAAARLCGLGSIGNSCLFLHKDFGARVRLGTLFTDCPFESPRVLPPNPCTGCNICRQVCPSGAISGKSWHEGMDRREFFNAEKCSNYMKSRFKKIGRGAVCGICIKNCPLNK